MKKISISLIFLIVSSLAFTGPNQLLYGNHQAGSSGEDPEIEKVKKEIVEKEIYIDKLLGTYDESKHNNYEAEYTPDHFYNILDEFIIESNGTLESYTKKLNALNSLLAYNEDGSIDNEKFKENIGYFKMAQNYDNLVFLFKLRDRINNRGNAGDTNLLSENVQKLSKDIQEVNKTANHALDGVSLAVAMANLPTVSSEYNHNISASYGTYAGSHSFALGLSGHIVNDRLSYKLSGAVNTKGNLAFGVGVGVNLGKKNQTNKELLDRIEKLENLVKQLQNK